MPIYIYLLMYKLNHEVCTIRVWYKIRIWYRTSTVHCLFQQKVLKSHPKTAYSCKKVRIQVKQSYAPINVLPHYPPPRAYMGLYTVKI